MVLSKKRIDGLSAALGTGKMLAVEVDQSVHEVVLTVQVYTLSEGEADPQERQFLLTLCPVARIFASLQHYLWGDEKAVLVPFQVDDMPAVVQSLKRHNIYGWETLDGGEENFKYYEDRPSLDWRVQVDDCSHTLGLFQKEMISPYDPASDGPCRRLYLRIWFGGLTIHTLEGADVCVDAFLADAARVDDWVETAAHHDGLIATSANSPDTAIAVSLPGGT